MFFDAIRSPDNQEQIHAIVAYLAMVRDGDFEDILDQYKWKRRMRRAVQKACRGKASNETIPAPIHEDADRLASIEDGWEAYGTYVIEKIESLRSDFLVQHDIVRKVDPSRTGRAFEAPHTRTVSTNANVSMSNSNTGSSISTLSEPFPDQAVTEFLGANKSIFWFGKVDWVVGKLKNLGARYPRDLKKATVEDHLRIYVTFCRYHAFKREVIGWYDTYYRNHPNKRASVPRHEEVKYSEDDALLVSAVDDGVRTGVDSMAERRQDDDVAPWMDPWRQPHVVDYGSVRTVSIDPHLPIV